MAQFCMYCGQPLNKDGQCPHCSAPVPKKESAKREAPQKKKRRKVVIVLTVVIAVLLVVLTLFLLMLFGVIKNPFRKNAGNGQTYAFEHKETPKEYISDTMPERPDARETLESVGTVVSETSFAASRAAQTEAEAYRDLSGRGFTQASITTSYDANGVYTEEKEISRSSNERHPAYQTFYVTADGTIWSILSVNGAISANPVSYNAEGYWTVMHLLSETGSCVQYDSVSGAFFEVVPDPSAVRVKTVSRIDAALLESMTAEEVDR